MLQQHMHSLCVMQDACPKTQAHNIVLMSDLLCSTLQHINLHYIAFALHPMQLVVCGKPPYLLRDART
jgi:hypothetical protein